MYFSFTLTLIAGLSTCIGFLLTFYKTKNIDRFICISLSFAMGVMFLISIKELLPNSIKYILIRLNIYYSIFILIIIPIIINLIIRILNKYTKTSDSLYRVGILNTICLIIHNIPEGILTLISSINNITLGLKISLAIIFHNIPEGISISIPIYYSTRSRGKAFLYTFIAGISEFIGAILFFFLFNKFISIFIINIMLYIIGCLMIIICIKKILPEIKKYNHINWIVEGVLLSLIILIL